MQWDHKNDHAPWKDRRASPTLRLPVNSAMLGGSGPAMGSDLCRDILFAQAFAADGGISRSKQLVPPSSPFDIQPNCFANQFRTRAMFLRSWRVDFSQQVLWK